MSKNYVAWVAATLILSLMGILMLLSILNNAPTADEPPHILSGYAALKFGEDYIDPEHPLLAKVIASTPLLFQDLKFDKTDPGYLEQAEALNIGSMFAASRRFLDYYGNQPDSILFSTRIPMIILTVAFGFVVFLFTRKLFGNLAAVLATGFYATEPLILGHGPLVNTDVPGAGLILLSAFALYLYFEKQTIKRLVFLILAISGALLAKYSTFVIFPFILFLMVLFYLRRPIRAWTHVLYVIVGVFICITVFYGLLSFREQGLLGFSTYQYVKGLLIVQYELSHDTRFAYLLGESYYGSRPYYFPILLLAKTQIILLLGSFISLILIAIKKIRLSASGLVLLLLMPAMFFGLALTTKFNIGVRHIMPVYLFMIILTAVAVVVLARIIITKFDGKLGLKLAALLILVVVGSRIWSIATTFPGYLSYYNIAFGGTENGWKVADDSNYDWGQDVKRLADYVTKNNITSIAFDNYTGDYAAKYYKIPVSGISPKDTDYKGYLALSASVITFHENRKDNYSWVVDKYQPIARAGYSIFIYKIE